MPSIPQMNPLKQKHNCFCEAKEKNSLSSARLPNEAYWLFPTGYLSDKTVPGPEKVQVEASCTQRYTETSENSSFPKQREPKLPLWFWLDKTLANCGLILKRQDFSTSCPFTWDLWVLSFPNQWTPLIVPCLFVVRIRQEEVPLSPAVKAAKSR